MVVVPKIRVGWLAAPCDLGEKSWTGLRDKSRRHVLSEGMMVRRYRVPGARRARPSHSVRIRVDSIRGSEVPSLRRHSPAPPQGCLEFTIASKVSPV